MNTAKKFGIVNIGIPGNFRREELRDRLGLTGCEVSVNTLPASEEIPFVHKHKNNEEVYLVLSGNGFIFLDGDVWPLKQGDAVKVSPPVERCLKAGDNGPLTYICVQAGEGATPEVTKEDGLITRTKAVWK